MLFTQHVNGVLTDWLSMLDNTVIWLNGQLVNLVNIFLFYVIFYQNTICIRSNQWKVNSNISEIRKVLQDILGIFSLHPKASLIPLFSTANDRREKKGRERKNQQFSMRPKIQNKTLCVIFRAPLQRKDALSKCDNHLMRWIMDIMKVKRFGWYFTHFTCLCQKKIIKSKARIGFQWKTHTPEHMNP